MITTRPDSHIGVSRTGPQLQSIGHHILRYGLVFILLIASYPVVEASGSRYSQSGVRAQTLPGGVSTGEGTGEAMPLIEAVRRQPRVGGLGRWGTTPEIARAKSRQYPQNWQLLDR